MLSNWGGGKSLGNTFSGLANHWQYGVITLWSAMAPPDAAIITPSIIFSCMVFLFNPVDDNVRCGSGADLRNLP